MINKLKRNKNIWDYYQTEGKDVFKGSMARLSYVVKRVNCLKKTGKVLDIGLGDGSMLELFIKKGYECFGIDIAKRSIEKIKDKFTKLGYRVELAVCNISDIKYENSKFDIVIASEVLEHLTNKDLTNGINEVYRCLKKDGVFVATVPAEENLQEQTIFCPDCGAKFHRWGHQQSFSISTLEDLFRGFSRTEVKRVVFPSSSMNGFGYIEHCVKRLLLANGVNITGSSFIIYAKK